MIVTVFTLLISSDITFQGIVTFHSVSIEMLYVNIR